MIATKEAGGIVGRVRRGGLEAAPQDDDEEEELDLEFVLSNTDVHESYCCEENGVPIVLCATLDGETGGVEWKRGDVEATLRKTVQMSQMSSMLHDTDRNAVYQQAINVMIASFATTTGRSPVVVDIGCGTGLLSMMAAKAGASAVIGCEMFDTMADIATQVVGANDYNEVVQIIAAKSLDVELEQEEQKADLLVSELLDSSLLGESVIFSHADGISRLLRTQGTAPPYPDISQRVIPHSAQVYATLVESVELNDMTRVNSLLFGCPEKATPYRSTESTNCRYSHAIPVHWEEVKKRGARELSAPTPVVSFEFFHADVDEICNTVVETDLSVVGDGEIHGILLWWDLFLLSPELDSTRSLRYSTCPGVQKWQDHWVQVLHSLPVPIVVAKGDVIRVRAYKDNLRIWVECEKIPTETEEGNRSSKQPRRESLLMFPSPCCGDKQTPPQCECGWHLLCSPFRIGSLNDEARRGMWHRATRTLIDNVLAQSSSEELSVVLDVSDESDLSIGAALFFRDQGVDSKIKIVSRESRLAQRLHIQQLAEANRVLDIFELWDGEDADDLFTTDEEALSQNVRLGGIVSECFNAQMSSRPAWAAFSFFYQCLALESYRDERTLVVPSNAKIMTVALEFENLCVSHGPAGVVSGFQHGYLDEILEGWREHPFPYKLADYKYREVSERHCLVTLDYQHPTPLPSAAVHVCTLDIYPKGSRCDAVAIFVDYFPGFGQSDVSVFGSSFDKASITFSRSHDTQPQLSSVSVRLSVVGGEPRVECTIHN